MICPKCKTNCKHNYCIKCGYMIVDQKEIQITTVDPEISDLRLYVKPSIYHGACNIKAGIFGPFYLCYIKLYILSGILILIDLGLFYLLFNKLDLIKLFVLKIISFFIYGTITNPIYTMFAKIRVEKLKKKYKNRYKDYIELDSKFNIIIPFIYLLVTVIIILIIFKVENVY